MPDVKLTESEKSALRSIGKKAYADMVRKVGGKKKMADIARQQGRHGIKGGRPQKYPDCTFRFGTGKLRGCHRFKNGVCDCGVKQK